jgi:anti-sigma B factor antagonist
MTNNLTNLLVALVDHAAVVKVNGRANFTTSVAFKRLVTELQERGFGNFVLDLSECITMDSTFLGVLAGTALKLSELNNSGQNGAPGNAPAPWHLRLLNPNQRVSDLLDNLGISELFWTLRCEPPGAAVAEYHSSSEQIQPTREELSKTCLEAHQLLMDLNPRNIPKFKDVTQFLAEDLKRLRSHPEAGGHLQDEADEACKPS